MNGQFKLSQNGGLVLSLRGKYAASQQPAHRPRHCFTLRVRNDGACYRHGEGRSNPACPHGLRHCVRNDGGSCGYRHGEGRSNPACPYGLLHPAGSQ
jgi:hypothetical protein